MYKHNIVSSEVVMTQQIRSYGSLWNNHAKHSEAVWFITDEGRGYGIYKGIPDSLNVLSLLH